MTTLELSRELRQTERALGNFARAHSPHSRQGFGSDGDQTVYRAAIKASQGYWLADKILRDYFGISAGTTIGVELGSSGCPRCGGTGQYRDLGACFRCGGTGQ